jgi:hypothetical protein
MVQFSISFFALLLTTASIGFAQDSSGVPSIVRSIEGHFAAGPASRIDPVKARVLETGPAAKVVLESVSAERLSQEMPKALPTPGTPLKIGFSRDLPALRTFAQLAGLATVTPATAAQIASISITSADALGIRLGLLIERMPTSAKLRFYARGTDQAYEVSGRQINETIARNIASGDRSEEARTYWSPIINGQEVMVEFELPNGIPLTEVAFSIPRLSHLYSSPLATKALQERIGQSGTCNLDSVCQPSWSNESLATAKMTFTSGGGSYLCTGTLLNDSDASTNIPYFLSANHCISSQTVASSLQTFWFYRANSCDSGTLYSGTQTLTGGATLLYNTSVTDTSFMRLVGTPPAGTYFAGWTATQQALSTGITGIHNPSGDLQKISFGSISNYLTCPATSGSSYSCSTAAVGGADHLQVVWSQGITEGGSSGSGIWVTSGASHYLVGQLHGGSSFCSAPTAPDQYGRFDVAYNAALYQWLGVTSSCSYSLSASSVAVAAGGLSGTVGVVTTTGCAWSASSNAAWITVTGGSSGTGNGSVVYAVASNTTATSRTGTLTIGGQTFTITQAGGTSGGTTTTNVLVNPGFESGAASWAQSSTGGYSLISLNGATFTAHAGSYYAWLGGYASGTDVLSQSVVIPANAASAVLRFWYKIATSETFGVFDRLFVEFYSGGTKLTTLSTLTNANSTAGAWVQSTAFNVSAYKGQTVELRFTATSDSSLQTSFLIDDVSLDVTTSSGRIDLTPILMLLLD